MIIENTNNQLNNMSTYFSDPSDEETISTNKENKDAHTFVFEISKLDDYDKIIEETICENFVYSIGYNETNDFKLRTVKKSIKDSYCLFEFDYEKKHIKISPKNEFPILKLTKTADYEIKEKIQNGFKIDFEHLALDSLIFLFSENKDFALKIFNKDNSFMCAHCNEDLSNSLFNDEKGNFKFCLSHLFILNHGEIETETKSNFMNRYFSTDFHQENSKKKLKLLCRECNESVFSSNDDGNSNKDKENNLSQNKSKIKILPEIKENSELDANQINPDLIIQTENEKVTEELDKENSKSISLEKYMEDSFRKFELILKFFVKIQSMDLNKDVEISNITFGEIVKNFLEKSQRNSFVDCILIAFISNFKGVFQKYSECIKQDVIKQQSEYKFFFKNQKDKKLEITEADKVHIHNFLLFQKLSKKENCENHADSLDANARSTRTLRKLLKKLSFFYSKINSDNTDSLNSKTNLELSKIKNSNSRISSVINKTRNSVSKQKKQNLLLKLKKEKKDFLSHINEIFRFSESLEIIFDVIESMKNFDLFRTENEDWSILNTINSNLKKWFLDSWKNSDSNTFSIDLRLFQNNPILDEKMIKQKENEAYSDINGLKAGEVQNENNKLEAYFNRLGINPLEKKENTLGNKSFLEETENEFKNDKQPKNNDFSGPNSDLYNSEETTNRNKNGNSKKPILIGKVYKEEDSYEQMPYENQNHYIYSNPKEFTEENPIYTLNPKASPDQIILNESLHSDSVKLEDNLIKAENRIKIECSEKNSQLIDRKPDYLNSQIIQKINNNRSKDQKKLLLMKDDFVNLISSQDSEENLDKSEKKENNNMNNYQNKDIKASVSVVNLIDDEVQEIIDINSFKENKYGKENNNNQMGNMLDHIEAYKDISPKQI